MTYLLVYNCLHLGTQYTHKLPNTVPSIKKTVEQMTATIASVAPFDSRDKRDTSGVQTTPAGSGCQFPSG